MAIAVTNKKIIIQSVKNCLLLSAHTILNNNLFPKLRFKITWKNVSLKMLLLYYCYYTRAEYVLALRLKIQNESRLYENKTI